MSSHHLHYSMSTWEAVTTHYDNLVQDPNRFFLEPLAKLVYQLSKNKEWNWLTPGMMTLSNLTLRLPQHPWPGAFICIIATPRGLVVELFERVGCLVAKAVPWHPLDVLPEYVAAMKRMVA